MKPLFAQKCNACHGDEPEKIKGGFDMRNLEAMLKGGDFFGKDVLIPGDGENSYLYVVTTRTEEDYEMPPKEADQLTEEEQWKVRDWINEGAPWPSDKRVSKIQDRYAKGVQVATSEALSVDWQVRRYPKEVLWAYRPLQVASVPNDTHPVDHFINLALEEIGLNPAPMAAPRELARRLSFGLTGLPPRAARVDRFVNQFAKDPAQAVASFRDELMASPHFGEHFGLQWLDVVRYADSAGFANDYARPNAWRYRDYVIRSFNEDKPYDEFVRQQLAGDEMDDTNPENLIATGFLRMGPWEQTSMSVFRLTRQQWLDDVTDSVGQTFLAHAMQCAKCHDHKFDPVPTRDYYRMMAVFSTTQFAERKAEFLPQENRTNFQPALQWVKDKVALYQKEDQELKELMAQKRKQETGSAKTGDNGLDPGDEASQGRIRKNVMRHRWEFDKVKPLALSVYTGNTIEYKSVGGPLKRPEHPWGSKGTLEKDHILMGGDAYSRGDEVQPGALSAATNLGEMESPNFPSAKGKRRLALAHWITDEKNPLTARVMVNRVWAWHFGRGLAGNPNNFGSTGALPTHPELLDYLAHWFMENDWSVKKLSALLTSSEAYRRSSSHPEADRVASKDPKREFYATFLPRRLTAEELRDSMLAVSGELHRQVGGLPARPDLNIEVAFQPRQIMGGTASVYEPDPNPAQRNRRSVYAERNRGLRDPFLESFNQPGPDQSCELRETSTVAPQALTLFNATEVLDRAIAWAHGLLEEGGSESEILQRAFARAFGRSPSPAELTACLEAWRQATREEESLVHEPETYPTRIQRTVMAEKTGEPYTFWEQMPAYETYQSDLQRSDVDARTRGLAHICLVLFNSNEFAYLD